MALEKQMIPVPLTRGIDTKSDPKQVPLGKLLTLENGMFQKPGEIIKRPGYSVLSKSIAGGGSVSESIGVAAYKNELDLFDGANLYSWNSASSLWNASGVYRPLELSTLSITQSYGTIFESDSAYHSSGLLCTIWVGASSTLYYSIVDYATGEVAYTATLTGTQQNAHVFALGSYFVVVYYDTSATSIKYISIPIATYRSPAAAVTFSTVGTAAYDAIVSGNKIVFLLNKSSNIVLKSLDSSFVISGDTTVSSGDGFNMGGLFSDPSGNIWGTLNNASNAQRAFIYNSSLVSVISIKNLETSVSGGRNCTGVYDSNAATGVFYYEKSASSVALVRRVTMDIAGTVGTPASAFTAENMSLVGRAFYYDKSTYFTLYYNSADNLQPTYFTMRSGTSGRSVAIAKTAGPGAGFNGPSSWLPNMNNPSGANFQMAIVQLTQVVTIPASGTTYVTAAASLNLNFSSTIQTVQAGGCLNFNGGVMSSYDGVNLTEQGFLLYPEAVTCTALGSGGSIAAGTYQYVATFEWADNNGLISESSPSIPTTIVVGAGSNRVTVDVVPLSVTQKPNVRIVIYRTTDGGSVFYRVTPTTLLNDYTVNKVSFTDSLADSDLIGSPEIYTTGGEVETSAPPAVYAIANYKNRVMVVPADGRNSIWFSQDIIPTNGNTNGTPVVFSPFLVQNVDQVGGDITALIQMDDALIVFKKSTVLYMYGDGPATNGSGSSFSNPQVISSDVGCTSLASVLLSDKGVFFKSAKGMCLLTRAKEVVYIGADVESYNSLSVTAANLISKYNQVRFILSDGTVLVFDYYENQWDVFTNHSATGACIYNNLYTFSATDGSVYQETPNAFTDNGTFIQLRLVTGWIQLGGLQGFQRIYEALILGEYESAHSLVAKVYYDFDSTVAQTTTITPTSTDPYQWRLLFNRQKCEAIKIELYDTQDSPAEGLRLSAISLKVGVKGGLNRMPAARTFS